MSQYYLMAQLPSLDYLSDTAPLPLTEERFEELCSQVLNAKMMDILHHLTLTPPRHAQATGSHLVDAWNEEERRLRLALAAVRAAKRGRATDTDTQIFPASMLQAARTAADMVDPWEAEGYLFRYRSDVLERLRPQDPFSDEAVFYYGLKLKLIARMRAFDSEQGLQAYRAMYHTILHGEVQEAMP